MKVNKKILAILIVAVIGLAGFQNLGKAQELPIAPSADPTANAAAIAEKFQTGSGSVAPIFDNPIRKPIVDVIKGVAFDKTTMKGEAVVLLKLESDGEDIIYLLKGSEILKLEVVETKTIGNFWFVRLSTGSENVDLLVQESGGAYISGTFRNYILSFEPYYIPYYGRYGAVAETTGQTSTLESSPFWR